MIRTEEFNKTDKERDDALEYYMRRCSVLEQENARLQDHIAQLLWSMEEHD